MIPRQELAEGGNMAVDIKQYIDQLAQTAGLSQEEKDNLLKVAANEKFSKGLEENILLRSDYSKNMDALKADKAAKDKEISDYYQAELVRTANNKKNFDQYAAKVQAYEQQYGPLDGGDPKIQQVQSDFLKKEDVDKMLQQQGNQMLTILEW